MGTSRNDPSPRTPPWHPALAAIGNPDISPARQCTELWRAAQADRGVQLVQDFSQPVLAEAYKIAGGKSNVHEAIKDFDATCMKTQASGLSVDMAKRALARCRATKGTGSDFIAELFSEAISYYASRDLPSFVAARGRISSTTKSIALKESLREVTKQRVLEIATPSVGVATWRRHMKAVLKHLASKEER